VLCFGNIARHLNPSLSLVDSNKKMHRITNSSNLQNAKAVIVSIAAAVLIYVTAIELTGYHKVSEAFHRISTLTWLLVLSLSLVSFLVRFVRWHFLLGHLGRRVPILPGLAFYMAGFALTTTPAKIGEAVRLWYLHRESKISYAESAPIFIFEQILDILAVALLSFLALSVILPSIDQRLWIAAVLLGLLLVPITLARADRLGALVLPVLKRRGFTKLDDVETNSKTFIQSLHSLAPSHVFFSSLVVGMFAWLAPGLGLYLILRDLGMGVMVGPETAIGVFMLSLLAGVVSIISGGVGTTEGALAIFLTIIGIDPPTAVTAAIISRTSTLWFAVGLGALTTLGIAAVKPEASVKE
jgi:glycosyltransferase 2 family protein